MGFPARLGLEPGNFCGKFAGPVRNPAFERGRERVAFVRNPGKIGGPVHCDLKRGEQKFQKFPAIGRDDVFPVLVPDLELRPDLIRVRFFHGRCEHQLDERTKILGIPGPGDEVVRIAVKNDQQVSEAGNARDQKDRDVPEICIRLDLAAGLVPLFIRAGGIADEEIGFSHAETVQQFKRFGKGSDPVSLIGQLPDELPGIAGILGENEDVDDVFTVRNGRAVCICARWVRIHRHLRSYTN